MRYGCTVGCFGGSQWKNREQENLTVREGSKGWTYRTYPLAHEAADHGSASAIFDLWRGKTDPPRLPSWADFEFRDFSGWHANLILYEVLQDPFDLLYRICGSRAAWAYGRDLTGKTMRHGADGIQEDIDLIYYQEMTEQRMFGICEGPAYWRGRHYLQHAFLSLPLAEDGDTVTHFITVLRLETLELRE